MDHLIQEQADLKQIAPKTCVLSDALTVQHIEEKYVALRQDIEALETISIDVAEVTHIDTSGYQLLVSLAKYCELHNKTLVINNPSAEFCSTLTLLGDQILKGLFGKSD